MSLGCLCLSLPPCSLLSAVWLSSPPVPPLWGFSQVSLHFSPQTRGGKALLLLLTSVCFDITPLVLLNSSPIFLNNAFIQCSSVSPLEYALCFLLGLSPLCHYMTPPFLSLCPRDPLWLSPPPCHMCNVPCPFILQNHTETQLNNAYLAGHS